MKFFLELNLVDFSAKKNKKNIGLNRVLVGTVPGFGPSRAVFEVEPGNIDNNRLK